MRNAAASGEVFMLTVALDDKWADLIDAAWLAELDATPFLQRCRQGQASMAELAAFAAQQFHYSRHFTRYLCALMVNLRRDQDRAELAANLFEELGLAGGSGEAHSAIYRRMLVELGVDPAQHRVGAATQSLVDTMLAACSSVDPMVGLGGLCLAAEAIVPHVYSQVMNGFLAAGVNSEVLEFFRIHIDGDDAHAVTMRQIIDRELSVDSSARQRLRHAAQQLISARTAFFADLGAAIPADLTQRPRVSGARSRHEHV